MVGIGVADGLNSAGTQLEAGWEWGRHGRQRRSHPDAYQLCHALCYRRFAGTWDKQWMER
jgi:hypothetical protein